jgi:hypothetical protein
VRVLFVVDVSQSMNVTDPAPPVCSMPGMCLPRRGQAVLDVVNAYPAGNGLEYALETFQSTSAVITQTLNNMSGFTSDSNQVKVKLPVLAVAGGQTNYEGALADAFMTLQTDMVGLDATSRSRARYIVIFMSDGLPAPVTATSNTPERILSRVKAIKDLQVQQRLAEVQLNTVLLAGPNIPAQVRLDAENLLGDMAREGGGVFRTFEANEKINFFYLDFTSFIRTFVLKSFIVSDLNARPGRSAVDTDGDGLSDDEEVEPGTDPRNPDTDGDGFNDLLEVRLRDAGVSPLYPGDADCVQPGDRLDDDGDGLLNCEERFIGTNPRLVDSDADGLPDDLEFRFNSNPVAADYLADSDFDGAKNGNEILAHTDPTVNDSADFSVIGYRYQVDAEPPQDPMQRHTCYTFHVDNVTLTPTLDSSGLSLGTNSVVMRMAATPEDSPEDLGEHRIACVRPRYQFLPIEEKFPPSGAMTVPVTAFKRLAGNPNDPEVFNASRDCIAP